MKRVFTSVGAALILLGLTVGGLVLWEYAGTNVTSHHHRDQVLSKISDAWKVKGGTSLVHTDYGDTSAEMWIPRFGSGWTEPILEGTGDTQLATGVGHWIGSARPGQVGNVVLFAHRVTHGEPFRDFPTLREGDKVIIRTRYKIYTYRLLPLDLQRKITDTETWVTRPHPLSGVAPGTSLITLGTCAELFHTDDRLVVFGQLVRTRTVVH